MAPHAGALQNPSQCHHCLRVTPETGWPLGVPPGAVRGVELGDSHSAPSELLAVAANAQPLGARLPGYEPCGLSPLIRETGVMTGPITGCHGLSHGLRALLRCLWMKDEPPPTLLPRGSASGSGLRPAGGGRKRVAASPPPRAARE